MRVDKYVMLVATMMPLVMAVLAILFLGLLLLTLEGCSPYPRLPYYELEEAIQTAETQEEKDYHKARARKIEDEVVKAQAFIEAHDWCKQAGNDCLPVCEWRGPHMDDPFNFEKHDISDIEKMYRWWTIVRDACKLYLRQ